MSKCMNNDEYFCDEYDKMSVGTDTKEYYKIMKRVKEAGESMTCLIMTDNGNECVLGTDSYNCTKQQMKNIRKISYDRDNKVMIAQYGHNSSSYNGGSLIINILTFMDDFVHKFDSSDYEKSLLNLFLPTYKFLFDLNVEENNKAEIGYIIIFNNRKTKSTVKMHYRFEKANGKINIEEDLCNQSCISYGCYSEAFNFLYKDKNFAKTDNILEFTIQAIQQQVDMDDKVFPTTIVGGKIQFVKMDKQGKIETNMEFPNFG